MKTQIIARGVAGFPPIVPTPGQAATPPGVAPRIRGGHQLPLLNHPGSPDSPLRVEAYHLTPGPVWVSIPPCVLGRVAEQAIRDTQGFCHISTDKSDRWLGGVA